METWDGARHAFGDGAAWLVTLAEAVEDAWSEPGLGVRDLRGLVGHACRSLLTRVAELTAHGCDIAATIGRPAEPPPACAFASFAVLGALAGRDGRAGEALRAMTGRTALRDGFTVL